MKMESQEDSFYLFREQAGIRLRSRKKIDYREDKFDGILNEEEQARSRNKIYVKRKEKDNTFKTSRATNHTSTELVKAALPLKPVKTHKRRRNVQGNPSSGKKMGNITESACTDTIARTQDGYQSLYSDEEYLISARNIKSIQQDKKKNTGTQIDCVLADQCNKKEKPDLDSPLLLPNSGEAKEASPKLKIISNIRLNKPPSKNEEIISSDNTIAVNIGDSEKKEQEETAKLFFPQSSSSAISDKNVATVVNQMQFLTTELMESRPSNDEIMSWIQTGIHPDLSEMWKSVMESMLITCSDTTKALLTALRGPVPPELIKLVEVFKKIDEETENYFRISSW